MKAIIALHVSAKGKSTTEKMVFSSLKTNQGRSVCHFEENFLSGRFFLYSCFLF
jgi:hypothetical protein